jgi:hypothetical protein
VNRTQPICDGCWERFGYGLARGEPTRLVDVEPERCAWCGQVTVSGIYLRADPTTLAFPAP